MRKDTQFVERGVESNRLADYPGLVLPAGEHSPASVLNSVNKFCRSNLDGAVPRGGRHCLQIVQRTGNSMAKSGGLLRKKIPSGLGLGLKIPSLRWIREGQTLPAGDAEATRSE